MEGVEGLLEPSMRTCGAVICARLFYRAGGLLPPSWSRNHASADQLQHCTLSGFSFSQETAEALASWVAARDPLEDPFWNRCLSALPVCTTPPVWGSRAQEQP